MIFGVYPSVGLALNQHIKVKTGGPANTNFLYKRATTILTNAVLIISPPQNYNICITPRQKIIQVLGDSHPKLELFLMLFKSSQVTTDFMEKPG